MKQIIAATIIAAVFATLPSLSSAANQLTPIKFETEEEAHELNDAWLGLPVRTLSGRPIGYVVDAVFTDNEKTDYLLVSPHSPLAKTHKQVKRVNISGVKYLYDVVVIIR